MKFYIIYLFLTLLAMLASVKGDCSEACECCGPDGITCVSYVYDCNYYKQKCNYDQDCTNRHQFCRQGYCEDPADCGRPRVECNVDANCSPGMTCVRNPTGWNRCCADPQCSGASASCNYDQDCQNRHQFCFNYQCVNFEDCPRPLQVCNTDYDCLDRQQYCARTHQCVDRQFSNYCNVNEDCTPEGVNLVCYNHQCINPAPNYNN